MYAVKLFQQDDQSFDVEVAALYALRDHPNVIAIEAHEVLTIGSATYGVIIMELGISCLIDVMSQGGPLREEVAKRYAFELLSGLEHMHTMDISHNDIKPDNILLAADGSVRIADFGQASNSEEYSESFGTRSYKPPEAAFLTKPYGADVWSAAVTIFVMLMGCWAFDQANDSDDMFLLRCENFNEYWELKLAERKRWQRRLPDRCAWLDDPLSNEAKSFIEDAMCVNPRTRKSVTELLKHAWFRTLDDSTPFTVTA
jgi:serine/threonine protein kinase